MRYFKILQNPTYFFNGYAAPPAQNTEEAAAIPSAGGAKMINGGGKIKGRRTVKNSAVKASLPSKRIIYNSNILSRIQRYNV